MKQDVVSNLLQREISDKKRHIQGSERNAQYIRSQIKTYQAQLVLAERYLKEYREELKELEGVWNERNK